MKARSFFRYFVRVLKKGHISATITQPNSKENIFAGIGIISTRHLENGVHFLRIQRLSNLF